MVRRMKRINNCDPVASEAGDWKGDANPLVMVMVWCPDDQAENHDVSTVFEKILWFCAFWYYVDIFALSYLCFCHRVSVCMFQYLRLAATLKFYGFIQFKACFTDYPQTGSRVLVSAGNKELNFRVHTNSVSALEDVRERKEETAGRKL